MATHLERDDLYDGLRVTVICGDSRYDGDWTIMKINPKKVKLTRDGKLLNCPVEYVFPLGTPTPGSAGYVRPVMPNVTLGSLVEFPANSMGKMPDGPDHVYVVISIKADMFNVALVGGDGGRYWHVREQNYDKTWVMSRSDIYFS